MSLAIFAHFEPTQILFLVIILVFVLALDTMKVCLLENKQIVDGILSFGLLLGGMCIPTLTRVWIILFLVLDSMVLLYSLFDFSLLLYTHKVIHEKTAEYIKNNEYDFYVQMNAKDRVIDCSGSILKLTKLSKKEILQNRGWKFIFDNMNIRTLNKQEFSLNNVAGFLSEFKECNSKHNVYRFSMEVENMAQDKQLDTECIRYEGIIQPIYRKNTLVARNVYFYRDNINVVEKLKGLVKAACTNLEDAYLQLDMLMSMSEGVVLYYDYQNAVYVATDCMRTYTKTDKKEYVFEEIFSHIHSEDVNVYLEQAKTVNSLAITKLKYRLLIADTYYTVEEDSIYMRKDYGLLSIIRIGGVSLPESRKSTPHKEENIDQIQALASRNIQAKLEKTMSILNVVLGEQHESNH